MLKGKITVMSMGLLLMTTACGQKDENATENVQTSTHMEAISGATHDELVEAVNDRDQLLALVNEIQQGLVEIKSLQDIVTVNTSESPDRRAIIKNDIAAIQQALVDRQARLDELEKKLSTSNLYSSDLKKTVSSLREQITTQTNEIARLNTELASARTEIQNLGTQVDSLNTRVESVTGERDALQERAASLDTQLNTCYYVLGSKKELKAHNIADGKNVLQGNFDQSYFTAADKNTLRSIPTYSKKAEVLTKQPKDSYVIEKQENGMKVIVITNPQKFWGVSNYLVIKTN